MFSFAYAINIYYSRILGLTNSFAYIVMLSGAHDILQPDHDKVCYK